MKSRLFSLVLRHGMEVWASDDGVSMLGLMGLDGCFS